MNWFKILLFAFCISILLTVNVAFLQIFSIIVLVFLIINFIVWIFKGIAKGGRVLDNNLRKSEFTLFPKQRQKRLDKMKEEEEKRNEIKWKVYNDN